MSKLHRELFLPVVFELLSDGPAPPILAPCTLNFLHKDNFSCETISFLFPVVCLPLGKFSALSWILQSALCPNSEGCFS